MKIIARNPSETDSAFQSRIEDLFEPYGDCPQCGSDYGIPCQSTDGSCKILAAHIGRPRTDDGSPWAEEESA